MPSFGWQIGDNRRWDDVPLVADGGEPARPGRFSLLMISLALGVVGFMAWWFVDRSVGDAVAVSRASLLTTFDLAQRAIAEADGELFTFLLAGDDPAWQSGQETLFAQGLTYDRHPLGLNSKAVVPETVSMTLSPDLTKAELQFEQSYLTHDADGVAQTVALRHSAIFRFTGQRWLLTSPNLEYWGELGAIAGQFLTVVFPERDEAIAERLARDLDEQIADLCVSADGIDCPQEGFRVRLFLMKSLTSLAQMTSDQVRLTGGQPLQLPTPTLAGLPNDEAGYQALYRGYASLLLTSVIADLVGWQCCDQIHVYQALLDKQLYQLGLQPRPLAPSNVYALLGHHFAIDDIDRIWLTSAPELEKEDRWLLDSFVDFLTEVASGASVADMLRSLSRSSSYRNWSEQLVEGSYRSEIAFKRGWLQFAYEQTSDAGSPAPIPLPGNDMHLFCLSGPRRAVYHYDLATERWSRQLSINESVNSSISPLPGRDGVVLYEQAFSGDAEQTLTILKHDGGATSVVVNASGSVFYGTGYQPKTLKHSLMVIDEDPTKATGLFRLLDLDSCDSAGCDSTSFLGLPIWSPDGTHTILSGPRDDNRSFTLTLADGEGRALTAIGAGFSPFWLDNETYGYARSANNISEVMIASVTDAHAQVLLTEEDLLAALPGEAQPAELSMIQVYANPADPDRIFIDAITSVPSARYIFSFSRQAGGITLNFRLGDGENPVEFNFSPDGRWWMLSTYGDPNLGPPWSLHLHDIKENQTRMIAFSPVPYAANSYDWSDDGQWLLKLDRGTISLFAPAHDYLKLVFIDPSMCTSAAWVHHR